MSDCMHSAQMPAHKIDIDDCEETLLRALQSHWFATHTATTTVIDGTWHLTAVHLPKNTPRLRRWLVDLATRMLVQLAHNAPRDAQFSRSFATPCPRDRFRVSRSPAFPEPPFS